MLTIFPLYGQMKISGTVQDENGKKLSGANIVLKGTNRGIVSNKEGKFTLEISEKDFSQSNGELIVTYIVAMVNGS